MVNKEVRIVISSVKGFNSVDRLKAAFEGLLADIYLMNEETTDEDEYIDDTKIVVMHNGERNTISPLVREIVRGTIDVEEIKVDWEKGRKSFFDNCAILGSRCTHAIVFWDNKDEGQRSLIKACLENNARVRAYDIVE